MALMPASNSKLASTLTNHPIGHLPNNADFVALA